MRARQALEREDSVNLNLAYSALFFGLKRHRSTAAYTFLYFSRRILYAGVTVGVLLLEHREDYVVFSVLTLLFTSLAQLAFTASFMQWQKSLMNVLDFGNEAFFYALCTMLVCFTGSITESEQSLSLGWMAIAMFAVYIAFNLAIINYELVVFVRLLWTRYYNISQRKSRVSRRNSNSKKSAPKSGKQK